MLDFGVQILTSSSSTSIELRDEMAIFSTSPVTQPPTTHPVKYGMTSASIANFDYNFNYNF